MRSISLRRHGGPEVLEEANFADPVASGSEVVIEVRAVSVNHLDIFLRRGIPGVRVLLPHVLGSDAAGIIRDCGSEVPASLAPGTRVVVNPGIACGRCEFCASGFGGQCVSYKVVGEHTPGTYAELLRVPADNVLPIPDSLTFEEAAAAPLVFMTAWSMLISKGRLQPGEDILVLGAGSGVSTAAIQLARLAGCRVFAAASSDEKLERAERLGADILINYSRDEFDKVVRELTGKRGVDVVVDHIGEATWLRSLRAVRRGGRILTCGATSGPLPTTDLRHVFYRQLHIIGSTMGSAADFTNAMRPIIRGDIHPVIDSVFPITDVREAHRKIEAREVFGKLILVPWNAR